MDALTAIKSWNKEYNDGHEGTPFEHEGITYYSVGHNASHSFALGVDSEGCVWKYASGEGEWDETTQDYKSDTYTRKVGSLSEVGYVGHF